MLPAHTDYSLLQLIGEVGTDLSAWKTEQHFTAWLGLAPGSHQSGKRKGTVRRKHNRAGRPAVVVRLKNREEIVGDRDRYSADWCFAI